MHREKKLVAGLLPFYLKLYDDHYPDYRNGFTSFLQRIAAGLEAHNIDLRVSEPCCVATEFGQAIADFEAQGVECIITLHLAYSPSLEALEAFCRTKLPIIILDTTMDYDFGVSAAPERIMYNHGVHGVMDFASMLRRRARHFEIVAGHDSAPLLLQRVADMVRAAATLNAMQNSRILRVGSVFEGMGDFSVAESVLMEKLGIEVEQIGLETLDKAVETVTPAKVATELAIDQERYICELNSETHARSVRVGLGLRKLLEDGKFQGVSVNFQEFTSSQRASDTMPFLEISKAMARGIGYGGEGDVLTAGLVGALATGFGAVTFTEIFCADWAGNSLFLSHMGEVNPAMAGDKPRLIAKPFFIGGSCDPAIVTCAFKPGPGVLVNLAPGADDTFTLIVSRVEIMAETQELHPEMRNNIRAWIRPLISVAAFLEAYSQAGGTHHSALVQGDHFEGVLAFGRMLGINTLEI